MGTVSDVFRHLGVWVLPSHAMRVQPEILPFTTEQVLHPSNHEVQFRAGVGLIDTVVVSVGVIVAEAVAIGVGVVVGWFGQTK